MCDSKREWSSVMPTIISKIWVIHSEILLSQLHSHFSCSSFSSLKLNWLSQYCIDCITCSISLTHSSKSAIRQLEISASPFRQFSSAVSSFSNIFCIFSMHFFMSSAFESSEFTVNNLLSHLCCFTQFWWWSFFSFWHSSSWLSHSLYEQFNFSCSVMGLSSLLVLNLSFEWNKQSEHIWCGCDVLVNSVMLNL